MKYLHTEVGLIAGMIAIPIVFLFVWLFNAYKMGKNIRKILRIISLVMFIIAVVFVFIAISAPTLGRTIYIGDFEFGAEYWRICYGIYAAVMVILFITSFFVKNNK